MSERKNKDTKEEKPEALKKQEEPAEPKSEEKKEEKSVSTSAKEDKVVPAKFKDLVKTIEEMSVLDLSELVKVLEEKFGVSAAAPVAIAVASVPGSGEEAQAEEKSSFDVELTEVGANKITAIKAVRAVTSLGLKDAKDLVEGVPKIVKGGVKKEEAEEIKKVLEEAGCKVTLK